MAAGRYTSRVFVAQEAWLTKLTAAAYPPHPTTGKTPTVEFGDQDPNKGAEKICLQTNPDDSVAVWARQSPAGRDEIIVLQATIKSYVDNVPTAVAAMARLKALTAVVEATAYDTTNERTVTLGYPGEVNLGLIIGVQPSVWATAGTWHGSCVVTLRSQASI